MTLRIDPNGKTVSVTTDDENMTVADALMQLELARHQLLVFHFDEENTEDRPIYDEEPSAE